jgi:hypothetical protein
MLDRSIMKRSAVLFAVACAVQLVQAATLIN